MTALPTGIEDSLEKALGNTSAAANPMNIKMHQKVLFLQVNNPVYGRVKISFGVWVYKKRLNTTYK